MKHFSLIFTFLLFISLNTFAGNLDRFKIEKREAGDTISDHWILTQWGIVDNKMYDVDLKQIFGSLKIGYLSHYDDHSRADFHAFITGDLTLTAHLLSLEKEENLIRAGIGADLSGLAGIKLAILPIGFDLMKFNYKYSGITEDEDETYFVAWGFGTPVPVSIGRNKIYLTGVYGGVYTRHDDRTENIHESTEQKLWNPGLDIRADLPDPPIGDKIHAQLSFMTSQVRRYVKKLDREIMEEIEFEDAGSKFLQANISIEGLKWDWSVVEFKLAVLDNPPPLENNREVSISIGKRF